MNFFNFFLFLVNYHKLLADVAKPQLLCVWIHMDVLNGGNVSFCQKIKVWWYYHHVLN
jgi:hypothetical protein